MSFFDWFKLGKDNLDKVNVKKIKKESVDQGAMAAASPAEAALAMAKIVDQNLSVAKVLMVQDGDYSTKVTEYALKMAQKLDCEIIALDVSEVPDQYFGERKEREINRFHDRAKRSFESFSLQGDAMGVITNQVMMLGDQEAAISELSKMDAGIRYVLTKPENEIAEAPQERVQVPVIDLNCSRL